MSHYVRSPHLMDAADTILVVIDIQQRLIPHIFNRDDVERNATRLVQAAKLTEIPVLSTVQYPKGLGEMVESLAGHLDASVEKLTFSCFGAAEFRDDLVGLQRQKILLCGLETHVCVQQSAFDLLDAGYEIYLPVDAIGSRRTIDHETAIRRLEAHGVTLCSTESILFEWCQQAGTELFRSIRKLID